MNPLELINFIEELVRSETKVIAFSVVSVLVTLFSVYALRHWVFPRKDAEKDLAKKDAELARKEVDVARRETEISGLERKVEERDRKLAAAQQQAEALETRRQREAAALQEKNSQLSNECEGLKEQLVDVGAKGDEAKKKLQQATDGFELYRRKGKTLFRDLNAQIADLTATVKKIEQQEGRFWETVVGPAVPPFRKLAPERAVVVAIANLKGGVGKTTLTANIAATYMRMGKRVLVVDLDHQTSLTTLCLTLEQIKDLQPGTGKYVNNLLKASTAHASIAWDNLATMGPDGSMILAANKELADTEEQVKAKWLLNHASCDARYVLRSALHDPLIQDRFDVILLDCPPRPSTCLVNALTACDYLLIPAKLDRPSTDTVPYFLGWLQRLRGKNICPDLKVLGLVANEAYPRRQLISRERAVWAELAGKCEQEWGSSVYQFSRFVPKSSQFAEAAATRSFAADHPSLEPIFTELVHELEERKVHHAGSSVAVVS